MPDKRRKPAGKPAAHPPREANGHAPDGGTSLAVAEASATPEPSMAKRYDIFVIDTGWNAPIGKALAQNIDHIRTYLDADEIYVLDRAQSLALIKHEPSTIGHDPMVLFVNRARKEAGHECFGLRLNLGLMRRPEQAMAKLQAALRMISENREEPSLIGAVHADLRKAGFDGAFRTLGEAALELA